MNDHAVFSGPQAATTSTDTVDRKGVYIYRTKGECTAELHYYPLRQEKAKRNPEKLCDAQEVLSFSLSFI